MRISRHELEALTKEELDRYPPSEMAAITGLIFRLANEAGVSTTPDERETIIDEITSLLQDKGFNLYEQYMTGSELVIDGGITAQ